MPVKKQQPLYIGVRPLSDFWLLRINGAWTLSFIINVVVVIKGTASAVNKKIRAAKEIKDSEKLRIMYDELINELLQEREEAVLIAQVYKAELDRIEISDKDIEHFLSILFVIASFFALQISILFSQINFLKYSIIF